MDWKQSVLVDIKPSKDEEKELQERINEFLRILNSVLKDAEAILGGSGAKGTWLKNQHDADVFVLFPYTTYKDKTEELSDILEKRLKKVIKKYERLHGSRDYFRVQDDHFVFEIVPILRITNVNQAKNITDISPLHARWVTQQAKGKIRDEIRLAKAFCRAQSCYGAESYIRGLSGYVLEILTIHYKGFQKLLKAIVNWEEKQIIDAGKLYKKKEHVWIAVNKAKLFSPLIVIDPVDKNRNAAAALNKEKWLHIKKKAKEFLKKPSAKFFIKKEVNLESVSKKKGKNHLLFIEAQTNIGKNDKVGAQALLAFDYLQKRLSEFKVAKSGWEWDKKKKVVYWFYVKKDEIDQIKIQQGPKLSMKEHVAAFKQKHKKTFTKNNALYAKIPVKEYKIIDVVKKVSKESYVKAKLKSVKKIVLC